MDGGPSGIAVDRNRHLAYVTDQSENSVSVIDETSNTVTITSTWASSRATSPSTWGATWLSCRSIRRGAADPARRRQSGLPAAHKIDLDCQPRPARTYVVSLRRRDTPGIAFS